MTLLSAPNINGNEWKYVKDCLDTGWVSSVGAYVDKFEAMVAEFVGAKYAVAASNGTSALHISMLLAGVKPGDYVIVPNLTFVASANAIKYTGADPILMDCDAETWQMDLDILADFLKNGCQLIDSQLVYTKTGRRVAAIMPVHLIGNMCDMDQLMAMANQYNLPVVEDATEALGSTFKGKQAGSFGQFGCFSFNGNKIITTGGGGMLVTDDEALAKRAKHLTTQAKSSPNEYIHDEVGYNYRLVNVLAAIGCAQMEQLPGFIERKREVADFYRKELSNISPEFIFQRIGDHVYSNEWLFTFRSPRMRELLKALNSQKLQSRPFWVPMSNLVMYKDDPYIHTNDVSNFVYENCLSIPCSTFITNEELERVVGCIAEVYQMDLA